MFWFHIELRTIGIQKRKHNMSQWKRSSTWSIFVLFCSNLNIAFSSDRTSEHGWNNNNTTTTTTTATTTTEQHLDMKIFLNAKQQMQKNSWTFNNENLMEAFHPSFASHHQTSPFPLTQALTRTRTHTHAHALYRGFKQSIRGVHAVQHISLIL